MPIPETTSADALHGYVDGKCLLASRGRAWREISASLFVHTAPEGMVHMPAVSEPLLHWVVAGEMESEERDDGGPWIKSRIRKGSFFLTMAGAAYDCRWRKLTPEPFEFMIVSVALPLLQRALEEVFGAGAPHARLRDLSGFEDAALSSLMERLRDELQRRGWASPLCVQGLAQAIAVHLARNYAEPAGDARNGSPSLPGHKLRQITDWMAGHLAGDLNLERLAARAGLSKFYFHRLFKGATGVSPSRYHTRLRMEAARRLLRETKKSVVEIALELGCANPSHFAQLFRRETGLPPSEYRRQR
ncbi:MAG: AraC family transcriptional regulator [Opitutaceae bacterium]|nr:AraC family transcriptional regulator [Opitutaceae bacterium]